jgi:hypothetical protein
VALRGWKGGGSVYWGSPSEHGHLRRSRSAARRWCNHVRVRVRAQRLPVYGRALYLYACSTVGTSLSQNTHVCDDDADEAGRHSHKRPCQLTGNYHDNGSGKRALATISGHAMVVQGCAQTKQKSRAHVEKRKVWTARQSGKRTFTLIHAVP